MALFKKGRKPVQETIEAPPKPEIEQEQSFFRIDTAVEIPSLPDIEDRSKIDIIYPLIAPYCNAHITWDAENDELVYLIEEPELSNREKKILQILEEGVKELINLSFISVKEKDIVIIYLEKNIKVLLNELSISISSDSFLKIMYYIYRDFVGLNELEPLLNDYYIEDVECNGVNTPIYVVHRKYRNIRTNLIYPDIDKLTSFVEKLAQKCGKYISYASPLLDGSLPDGSLDYKEPFIYKENGIVKISKIGKVIDKFYNDNESNIPVKVSNIEVPAFDPKTLKITWKKVGYVYRHKINEPLYKLKLEFGRELTLTGAHSIFKLTKDGIKPEKTSNIKENDYLAIPLTIPENSILKEFNLAKELAECKYSKKLLIENIPFKIFIEKKDLIKNYLNKNYKQPYQAYYELRQKGLLPIKLWHILTKAILKKCKIKTTSRVKIPVFLKINKELMRLLGYYIAEGWTIDAGNHKKVQFSLNKKEKSYIEDIKKCFKKCFSAKTYVESPKKNAVKLNINSLIIWLVFNNILKVSHYAKEKSIPEIIFNVNKKLQREFLKGWHNGDFGSTASPNLATGISYLSLFNKNIIPFYERDKVSKIENRLIKSHEYYTNSFRRNTINNYSSMIPLEIFNPLNEIHIKFRNKRLSRNRLRKIINEIRFKRFENRDISSEKFLKEWEKRGFFNNKTLTGKGENVVKELNTIRNLIDSDLGFIKVKSIERIKSSKDFVYDVSVKGYENFIGGKGGICCHNSRVNATYTQEVSSRGPTFTVRRFTAEPWSPIQLIQKGTASPEIFAYLWLLTEYESNVMVIGGTGTGKTTFINGIAFFIPPQARIVSIEDSVTGDSKIIIKTKDKKLRNIMIKEFVEKKINAKIMTLDTEGKIIFVKPSKYIKHFVKKDIYQITTSTGRKIKVTQDHSLFSLGDNGLIEVKPIELKGKKSFIAVPRVLPIEGKEIKEINLIDYLKYFKDNFLQGEPIKKIFKKYNRHQFKITKSRYQWWKSHNIIKIKELVKINIKFNCYELNKLMIKSKNKSSIPVLFKITDEFLEFCGLWLGDGGYSNYNKNSVIISNQDKECRNIFKKVAKYIGSNYSIMNDRGMSLRLHNTIFYKFMKKVIGLNGYSDTKKIPEFIFGLSNKQLKHFIKGYFSADGCIKKYEVSCASQSYPLLEDLQTIFLRLGIISRINDLNRKDKCINMSISTLENINKYKEIGFLQSRKNKKLALFDKKATHANSDIIPLSVQKINKLNNFLHNKLSWQYTNEISYIGRDHLQRIAPPGSEFNDISHTDILWDKVKEIKKISSNKKIEVFDLSIPGYEKFLCNNIFVHNTREINLEHENWLPSVTRAGVGVTTAAGTKAGEITLFDLLKESFRQRPDYVIVGEVRGPEAYVLFQGMASGHPSMGTMHADSVLTMIKRLETPPINLSPALVETMDAVCIMIQSKIKGQEVRRLSKVEEIVEVGEAGKARTNTPLVWDPRTDKFYFKTESYVFNKISLKFGTPKEKLVNEFKLRALLLKKLLQNNITGFKDVQKIIHEYYKSPIEVLKRFKII